MAAKKVNGKQKGNTFERKCANLLSERFKDITGIEKSFRRSVDSGSFFGGSNAQRMNTYDTATANFGDLVCPSNFKYTIECKHYKSAPTFQSIVNQNVKQWDEWMGQASQDSKNANKLPMLIIKYNNVPEMVFIDHPIEGMQEFLKYKEFYAYSLDTIIKLDDKVFFG